MTHAIQITQFGGPEVFKWSPIEVGAPGPLEVRLRQTAVGVNFADVYMRSGNHPAVKTFPATLGVEAAGIVEAVGDGVRDFGVGDRVAYSGVLGAYSEVRLVPADRLVKLPASIEDKVAAAVLAKGITARYLCLEAYPIKPGDVALVHAAAGGVGMILCQWAAALGATVIGSVGSEQKAEVARAHGCEHAIVTTREDFVSRVADITGGKRVSVVYDALGGETSIRSLDCLRPRGTLVMFGRTIGWPHPIEPATLMQKGSLIAMMTQLVNFTDTAAERSVATRDLFAGISGGQIKVNIGQQYRLDDAAQAHRDLESRRTMGSTVLLV